ncbi:mycothiol transferase [Aquipuribacter sp. SD81]|uniref:mycothiol transferase n=1 Tax=Aquipuribacter sp. SD81 TaxID=3127703 RepID=UPI003015D647
MDGVEVLVEAVGRVRGLARPVVDGLDEAALTRRPGGGNPVVWLVWHAARVQDDHVADATGGQQVWLAGGWARRFGLALEDADTGYGHAPEQVAAVRGVSGEDLAGYLEAVCDRTTEVLRGLGPDRLDDVVDDAWDPPVTLGARLVSVVEDDLQHLGQASYARGLG